MPPASTIAEIAVPPDRRCKTAPSLSAIPLLATPDEIVVPDMDIPLQRTEIKYDVETRLISVSKRESRRIVLSYKRIG
jgi:hypothetical protein